MSLVRQVEQARERGKANRLAIERANYESCSLVVDAFMHDFRHGLETKFKEALLIAAESDRSLFTFIVGKHNSQFRVRVPCAPLHRYVVIDGVDVDKHSLLVREYTSEQIKAIEYFIFIEYGLTVKILCEVFPLLCLSINLDEQH